MTSNRIVIAGAGVAGTVLAYWLGKQGFEVVVLERSSLQSTQGQIIDVEGPARQVIEKMGILEDLKKESTKEASLTFVDETDRPIVRITAGETNLSNEIEIMRPILVANLMKAAGNFENVSFRTNCTITSVQQSNTDVTVDIEQRGGKTTTETFDLLVAADGLRSKTRSLILPHDLAESCLYPIDAFAAFFSIPAESRDRPHWRNFTMTSRRQASIKPLNEEQSSAYLTILKSDQELRQAVESKDQQRQKEGVAARFRAQGWECDRLVDAMLATKNFYFEGLCQVRLDKWSYGRCVLVGDTAYAPSPLTGEGTNLAIMGAYILAWALSKHSNDFEEAFQAYDKRFRPYVKKVQPIPLGGYLPLLVNPDTAWGVWILRNVFSIAGWLQPWKYLPVLQKSSYDLPEI